MEEPAPGRDHDPLPAVRLGRCPQRQCQGLLRLFSFLKAIFLLRASTQPAQGADPPHCSQWWGDSKSKLKLVEKCYTSSGIFGHVLWLSVTEHDLWGTKKHRGLWL